ncbi:hypothetical protein PVAG01_09842 [Phlyctema vagabunda]|uniref:DUF7907 domain-containing protein n=1 Tax=Phlyctema vagabunda TaxID=108571 RepID=A0ABR4P474_9HELO
MVLFRSIAVAASALAGLVSALPAEIAARQTYTPGTLNNTREFYISMTVTDGPTTYNGWQLEAYHTGAGLADPVFVAGAGSRAYLNGTSLQFDVSPYAFGAEAFASDTNYARWEPVSISSGYGSQNFVNQGPAGLQVDSEEHDGWIVCEWFHDRNAPQLFQLIAGFDTVGGLDPYTDIPATCARVLLFPQWI